MERNRWDAAIRCLDVALHPGTQDEEVLAGVNGFRRLADGRPLGEICIALVGHDDPLPAADAAGALEKSQLLNRENLDLRRQLELAEAARAAIMRRLREAERRTRDLGEELAAARRRADTAEQQHAEFASMMDEASRDNLDLRSALEEARRGAAQPAAQTASPPFREFLAAARRGSDHIAAAARRRAEAAAGRASAGSRAGTAWTA